MTSSTFAALSQELANTTEQAGASVVTVHARHRVPSSGVHWRKGVVITADHTIRREGEITLVAQDGKRLSAHLAGRDPGTDLAVLKLDDDADLAVPEFGDAARLKLANLVLALGRTRQGNLVASAGVVGGIGGEWRTWRGGRVDLQIRLALDLYPGFSGGPLVGEGGKVFGINTGGLARGRAVALPVSTVDRTTDELLEKGHISRPYLGLAMQPVALPEKLRGKLESAGGLMVLHVEGGSPADKAGIVLGDILVELKGKAALDTHNIQDVLHATRIGEKVAARVIRGGAPSDISITLEERPAR